MSEKFTNDQLIKNVVEDYLKEKRAARRWSFVRWSIVFLTVFIVGFGIFNNPSTNVNMGAALEKHTAMISLTGSIQVDGDVDAFKVNQILKKVFDQPQATGVILRLNSPGGSPVQSAMIYDEIIRLRQLKPEKKIIAVVEDIAASGGYFIASAADEIYVNKSSIVGSIGVLVNGFGFTEALKNLGVERRLLTAGKNKAMLDPFSPKIDQHEKMTQEMLNNIHDHFITAVKDGRGQKLSNNPEIFSGRIYTGEKSLELGLSDGYGSVNFVAKTLFNQPKIIDYSENNSFLERISDRLMSAFFKSMKGSISNPA